MTGNRTRSRCKQVLGRICLSIQLPIGSRKLPDDREGGGCLGTGEHKHRRWSKNWLEGGLRPLGKFRDDDNLIEEGEG